eukprot:224402_1
MMVWFSILLYFVSIQLDNFVCCPVGYDSCNLQDSGNCPPDPTTQNHGEVAFGTDSDGIWTYKSLSTTTLQRDCTVTEFGDPSPGNAKECCITNLSDITIAANIVGEMSCGDTTKVWFKDEINRRHWKLTTTQSNDITYYGCNTGFDSTTTVYNSSLAVISNTQCSPNIDGFGNNCGLCASSTAEEFTLTNQEAGVYWIRIGYFSDTSAPGNKIYELTITCNPNTVSPTTVSPTTNVPTTSDPTTALPTTAIPTTNVPTTTNPTTGAPTSAIPTTINPTTYTPSSTAPTTWNPTTSNPTTDTPTTYARSCVGYCMITCILGINIHLINYKNKQPFLFTNYMKFAIDKQSSWMFNTFCILRNRCQDATIICPNDAGCNIQCLGSNTCHYMTI